MMIRIYTHQRKIRPTAAVILLVVASICSAQPDTLWTYTYDSGVNDELWSVAVSIDGGFVIAGKAGFPDSGLSAIAIKIDEFGQEEWIRAFGGDFDEIIDIIEMSDGGYAMTGDCGFNYLSVIRTDSLGEVQWSHCLDWQFIDKGVSIVETEDGGVATLTLGGTTYLPDILLVRFNADGDTLWTRWYGGEATDYGAKLITTAEGGFFVFGSTNHQAWIFQTDSIGLIQWSTTVGVDSLDEGLRDAQITENGDLLVAGSRDVTGSFSSMPYVIRLTQDGDTIWTREYPEYHPHGVHRSIRELPSGEIAMAISFNQDYHIIILNSDGEPLRSRNYDSGIRDEFRMMRLTEDDGFILAGSKHTVASGSRDFWVVRTESVLSTESFPAALASDFFLLSNYPNPFNSLTTFRFEARISSPVSITVFDVLGRTIFHRSIDNALIGVNHVSFDASPYSSGNYYYTIEQSGISNTGRMVLLK